MHLVGYAGTFSSGKDCAGDYTAETRRGKKISLSDILRKDFPWATNSELREQGNKWRARYGAQILAERAYETLKGNGLSVIVSIRHPMEAQYLEARGAVLAWIDGPPDVRFRRYASLVEQGKKIPMTVEQFEQEENIQLNGDGTGFSLTAVRDRILARDHIWNDFPTLEDFHKRIEKFLRAYKIYRSRQ